MPKSKILPCVVSAAFVGMMLTSMAEPFTGYYYPSSIQAGATVRVVVGGQGLGSVRRGWVSGEDVEIIDIEHVPAFTRAPGEGQVKWVGEWLRNLEDGVSAMPKLPADEVLRNWPRNRWWETLDRLDPISLAMVKHNHYSPRPDPLQAAPAISERLLVTIRAKRNVSAGLRKIMLYGRDGASAPAPFFITEERHVAEPLYQSPLKAGKKRVQQEVPVQTLPVVLDGQILPGETDSFRLSLQGGDRFLCMVTGRELTPYLGDAVPGFFNPVVRLVDPDGNEVAFADDYYYLPDPVLECKISKSGIYTLEIRDNLYRGRDDFVYSVECFNDGRKLPTVQERAALCRPLVKPTGEWAGEIACPGAKTSFRLDIEEPGEYAFDLFARRIGSPLDGMIRLYGPMAGLFYKDGPLLATWDDVTNSIYVGSVPQAECDPRGIWKFTESGEYRVTVEDRVGGGGDGCEFRLDVASAKPDFEVYAVKSSQVLNWWRGARAKFRVKAVRKNGFKGEITIVGDSDVTVEKGLIPADKDEATVEFGSAFDWQGVRGVKFRAVGTDASGRLINKDVIPGTEVEQAFAYTHILPTDDFIVVRERPVPRYEAAPGWIGMPYDGFLPRRIIHKSANLSTWKNDYVLAMNELMEVDVQLADVPNDANDGVLGAKFASSAGHSRNRRSMGAFAVEVTPGRSDAAAARAVLAGLVGMVNPALEYVEGDDVRVRTMAFAMKLKHDNDVLLYVPQISGNSLSGTVGAAARRLRAEGWCFDFATDRTLREAMNIRVYRSVYVPKTSKKLSDETRELLENMANKRDINVVYEKSPNKRKPGSLGKRSRRETLPRELRFARYGRDAGEGWYFVHNPTSAKVEGICKFNIRGKADIAYFMDVKNGSVTELAKAGAGEFKLALNAGSSAWIYARTGEVK